MLDTRVDGEPLHDGDLVIPKPKRQGRSETSK